jgi:glycosyltransferase involved in cell wall biosynthesis
MKIAIVVHGRFHGFDLARALLERGHEVVVFTNYPRWAAARFGLARDRVRSFARHGALSRAASRATRVWAGAYRERWLHELFGGWAAAELARETWDVVHCWSGVSEELLRATLPGRPLRLLMRGSAHIEVQDRLLAEEEARTGCPADRPSPWMMARETREYALADRIAVLSSFARQSFIDRGVAGQKVDVLALGVDTTAFRPAQDVIAQRQKRMAASAPLTVLYVGALSFQKGLWDLLQAAAAMRGQSEVRFVLVGPRTEAMRTALAQAGPNVEVLAKRPQRRLPDVYWGADLFVFPTIHDGFGLVLTQAKAAGLPILATTNSAAPDLISENRDGWIVPIRDPRALAERLRWCEGHRAELASMTEQIYRHFRPRDWADVAADFEARCQPREQITASQATHLYGD